MTFSILVLVSALDFHIKPDRLIYVIIYLSHILHLLFSSIDFYIAEKIFEMANCENKSLRELPLFNLQMFFFLVWFHKDIKQCRSVQSR